MKYSVEHIIHKLREAEVLLAKGQTGKELAARRVLSFRFLRFYEIW